MAASRLAKGKKVVNQEELRRLMREKQRETADRKKRVESPFAKYNSLGHLSCVLCNTPVKNEILWQTHMLGKQHKEKVAELKGVKQVASSASANQTPAASTLKRKALDSESVEVKKVKAASGDQAQSSSSSSGLPADFFDSKGSKGVPSSTKSKPSGLNLVAGDYEENDTDEEKEAGSSETTGNENAQKNAEFPLPADSFDSIIPPAPAVSHSGSIHKADEQEKPVERKDNTAEALPEGFFDDPVKDAKVRKVDAPKDQMDKEWDEFQKEMRQVTNVSEAIVAEDDEEGRLDRQIGEIDEQIECYRRVEVLRNKQEMIKEKLKSTMEAKSLHSTDEIDSEEEEELQDLLSGDWRAKGALS
ncbi:zinc finger protein 830 isoform X1 [Polyodon spathula]|uniref:zinc finger protein 830 isoform X1 n=1 Tax=Polyodon spathula TaxID=7913 RepID=UPI001B7F35DC|nr:zinc finger protein 830 isoform X1 [Polyodon spathula]